MKITSSKFVCVLLSLLLAACSLTMNSCENKDTAPKNEISHETQTEKDGEKQEKPKTEKTLYVSAEGNAENDGLTPETALNKVETAITALAGSDDDIKKIVVSGFLKVDGTGDFPAHSDMITISGDGTAVLSLNNNGVNMGGPLTFENIELQAAVSNKFISTGGNALVIGEGVTTSAAGEASPDLNLHIGKYNGSSANESVEINSDVTNVHVGAYYNDDTQTTEGATVTVNGGDIKYIYFGSDGWQSTQKGVAFTDTVNVIYNGGSIGRITFHKGNREPVFECAVQLIANNGMKFPAYPDFFATEGFYLLNCEASDRTLSPTDTAGIFAVNGDGHAKAVDKKGNEYISANSLLYVPAGEYTVTFADGEVYQNDGETITILADCELNLANVLRTQPEGKLFVGWEQKNGKPIKDASFKKGTVLKATYADFDINTDLVAPGAKISDDGEGKLEFFFEKTESFKELDIVSTGIMVADSEEMGRKQLTKESLQNSNIQYFTFEGGEKDKTVTAELNIAPENYDTVYCARTYCTYKNTYGEENTLYSDIINTSLYNLALTGIDTKTLEGEALAFAEDCVLTVKQVRRQEYINQEKVDIAGTSADKRTWIYQLKDCGIMVREAEIDTGFDGKPVEIVQLTDLHFNYCNEQDFEEANPSIMATYKGRKWLAGGSSVGNAKNSLKYASTADQIVITGDMLDYMSWGCIELAKTHVFDVYPTVIATLGNHEATRRCQDTPATPDPTTLESRMDILNENWIHDVYYYSKVLDERVMLIQLDNAAGSKFWDSQIEPFKADLELAREKGYTVLLFYHIPLCTNNPAETDLYPIRRNDSNNYNFMTGGIGAQGTEGVNKTIYDLIVNNGDIIRGAFCGHKHSDYYTEIVAKTADGKDTVIPQYILTGNPYDKGHALKITVK